MAFLHPPTTVEIPNIGAEETPEAVKLMHDRAVNLLEREQKRAARKGRKRGLRRGFKAKRGEALAQDGENAPPQDAASQEALSPQKHSPTSVMQGPKLTSGQPSHAKGRGLSVAIPTRKLGAVSRLGSVREPTPSRSSPGR